MNLRFRIPAAVLAGCLCVLFTGCGKNGESNARNEPRSPEVAELTQQVRRYSFEKHKLPQNLEELVTAGYIKSVPAAPSGKKYAIDANRAEVILVRQ